MTEVKQLRNLVVTGMVRGQSQYSIYYTEVLYEEKIGNDNNADSAYRKRICDKCICI